jgi:phosphohistidine phosphatase
VDSRRLTLLRHGHAEPAREEREDFDRPLSGAGVSEATRAAERILADHLVPDLIVASPARRTSSTAGILAETFAVAAHRLQFLPKLYLASGGMIWRLLPGLDAGARHVLICGHNPGLSELASRFGPLPRRRELRTADRVSAIFPDQPWISLDPGAALRCDVSGQNE